MDTATAIPTWADLQKFLPPQLVGQDSFYFRGQDNLRITSFNSLGSVTLQVEGRFLTRTGEITPFAQTHIPNSDRSSASTSFGMGEGWLLNVQVRATVGSPRKGQCFVVVEVIRGDSSAAQPLGLLIEGYVTDTQRLPWPGALSQFSTEGNGNLRSVTGTNPAAGAEIVETVPTNARWKIHAVQFSLVTAVAAANREVALVFDDGTNIFCRIPSGTAQIASLTRGYTWYHAANRFTLAQDNTFTTPMPLLSLAGGSRMRTITTAIQGADDYGAPQYLVEEWIED